MSRQRATATRYRPNRLLALLPLLAGCAFSHINLVQDHRVHIVSPPPGAAVRLPVTVRWTTTGLPPTTRFAVFVDRPVIKPGASLRTVAAGDEQCLANPSCPSLSYLRAHDVYVVRGDQLTLRFLPDLSNGAVTADQHNITVVILNGENREGESAFTDSFTVDRSST